MWKKLYFLAIFQPDFLSLLLLLKMAQYYYPRNETMSTPQAQFNDVHVAGIYLFFSQTKSWEECRNSGGKKKRWGKGKLFFGILLTSEIIVV